MGDLEDATAPDASKEAPVDAAAASVRIPLTETVPGWRWLVAGVAVAVAVGAAIFIGVQMHTARATPTEKPIAALTGNTDSIQALAFSPDSRILASSSGKTVMLWDVATGRKIATLPSGGVDVMGLAFSPDGRTLAGAGESSGGVVCLWDVAAHQRITVISGALSYGWDIATFSPDGKTIAAASLEKDAAAWDVATRHRLPLQPEGSPQPATFPSEQDTSGKPEMLQQWTLPDGEHLAALTGAGAGVDVLAFDMGTLPSHGPRRPTLRLQDPANRRPVANLADATWAYRRITLSPDAGLAAGYELGGPLLVEDLVRHQQLAKLGGTDPPADAITFSPDSKIIAAGDRDDRILLWATPRS
ncbi:WD40 repeat domain-containing protein [Actinomadura physcomitrii]|uniref:WD40 repeat domain-containing protein n=1 Tax=Actinomadura physcomitrii TaxID=2650748 RepID=UPI00136E4C52|nr:hypothetical protein [Actinomadura physcomitrii]